jgi:hypothetical protein
VLLICGIVMYVGLLETIGSIDWLGEQSRPSAPRWSPRC